VLGIDLYAWRIRKGGAYEDLIWIRSLKDKI
jgi:hypothetical protein